LIEEKINGNIRANLDTDNLFCNRCMSHKHIVSIDLIGRILKINGQYVYLCTKCGDLHEWRADGTDLQRCPSVPRERLRLRSILNNEENDAKYDKTSTGIVSTGKRCRRHCFIDGKLCTGVGVWLLHVPSCRLIHFDLCSLHVPPAHMNKYINDTDDYIQWLLNSTSNGSGSSRKKRR